MGGTGSMVKMLNSIFVSSFITKLFKIGGRFTSLTFSCNFVGFRGRGSKPLAQAVVTELKLCKLNRTFTSLLFCLVILAGMEGKRS